MVSSFIINKAVINKAISNFILDYYRVQGYTENYITMSNSILLVRKVLF